MTAKTQTAKALANFDEESKRSNIGDNNGTNSQIGDEARNRRNSSYLVSEMRQSQGDDANISLAEQDQAKARASPDLKGDYNIEEIAAN